MKLKATALILSLILYITHVHAQEPSKIKIAKPNSTTADSIRSPKQPKIKVLIGEPDLQRKGFDLGVIYKSPQSFGVSGAYFEGLFGFGKYVHSILGLYGGSSAYISDKRLSGGSLELGLWYWHLSVFSVYLTQSFLWSKDFENDLQYFSFKPGIRYAISTRFSCTGGLQFDLKQNPGGFSPHLTLAFHYRIGL